MRLKKLSVYSMEFEKIMNLFINSKYSWFDTNGVAICYDHYKEFLESFLTKANVQKNIHFDYIRSNEINAVIDTSNPEIIEVFITEVTMLKIYEFFSSINYSFNLVECADNIEVEDPLVVQIQSQDDRNRTLAGKLITKSRKRNIIAEYMSMFAMKFIILHEIGHLLNGHCNYARSINKNAHRFNMNTNLEFTSDILEAKAIEMDADAFAACALLDEVYDIFKNNDIILSALKYQQDVYSLYAMAIQGVFFLLEEDWEANHNSKTHPPANIRGIMCVEGAKKRLASQNLNIDDSLLMSSIARITNALTKMYNWDQNKVVFNMEKSAMEFDLISTYWKSTLSKKLRPYPNVYVENINIEIDDFYMGKVISSFEIWHILS